ncbi:Oar protein [Thermomonas sp.]|uniref:TonB-dependent receptor n=1 Tax=Thermomonas sp. TaxID=1971895 RepID=UPI0035B23866
MASNYIAKGLKRSALTVALGLSFVGGVQAQTNTAGAVTGRATSGDTITISNPSTGFSRTITVGADGGYRFSQLPTGQYQISRNGAAPRNVTVNVGSAATVDFAGGDATTLDTVTVVGSGAINPIDISSVESTTILTAEQINKIPVARDTTSVALLAPGTVRGDAAFGNLASFGGASVAENQYYVNGFNVTNSFRSLNYSSIPFEAIAEQQTKTGGYGAEFGRSLGGVVNQITKRGTNEFHAGGNVFWSPNSLRSDVEDTYYSNPLTPEYGDLRQDNSHDTTDGWRANLWASGALIKDRLFAYGLISYARTDADTFGSVQSTTNTSSKNKAPQWVLKLDWNISDNHILEFTGFSDKNTTYTDSYDNAPGSFTRGAYNGQTVAESGGDNYILKYTGYITDNFTLSALAGQSKFARSTYVIGPDGTKAFYDGNFTVPTPGVAPNDGCSVLIDSRPSYRTNVSGVYSGCSISNGTLQDVNSGDKRNQYRIDAEWQLGAHLVRFGFDADQYKSRDGSAREGGYQWTYLTSNGADGKANTGDEFDVARLQYTSQGANVEVKQHAFYIEDSWNITDNFIAYLGGRWDTFENINGQGATYVKINNQFGPRLGFSWDVFGDSTFKVFGNAGRYALPLTPSVAVRGASASLFTREDFRPANGASYFIIDPETGAPLNAVSRGNFRFINAETGNPKDADTIASKNLKPMYQDEFILGFQKQLTEHFSLGARTVFRELKAAIDDNCDYTAVLNSPDSGFTYDPVHHWWYDAQGNAANLPNEGFPYCRMFNPGEDAIFVTDFLGDGNKREVHVPGELLSPKAKRTYQALEVFFEGSWDKLFLQGSYTYAKSKGNTEGGVKSDIGQGDTNVTQDFDYYALTVDTYGYLPNDRRHSLKLFGNYELTDEFSIGFNALIQSGRPLNCLGVLDLNPGAGYSPHPYGSSFMRCSTTGNATDDSSVVAVPRGTMGRLPWTQQYDVNFAYAPNWAKGLQFKVDIFNVFNKQKVTSVNEQAEVSATGSASNTYLLPASFQAPRSVRFMVQYDF